MNPHQMSLLISSAIVGVFAAVVIGCGLSQNFAKFVIDALMCGIIAIFVGMVWALIYFVVRSIVERHENDSPWRLM